MENQENSFGRISKLHLEASVKDRRTILSDVSFTAPYKVMHPFYEKKGIMSVTMLAASAGIMAGDRQDLRIHVREGARMALTSQSYEKIHRMEKGYASRKTSIRVEDGAALFYTPLPTIPFQGSDYRSQLDAELSGDDSQFVLLEILTCGRAAHGERFLYRRFQNQVTVRQAGKIIYRDNTLYQPEWMDMSGFGMYEGYTHLGNLALFNTSRSEAWINKARRLLDETDGVEGGVTRTARGDVAVRALGKSAQRLSGSLEKMVEDCF